MKRICLLVLVTFSYASPLFAQESIRFEIPKSSDDAMDLVYAFTHDLKHDGITDGYMDDQIQGTYISLINPRQGDRSLDQYAVSKNIKSKEYLVQATWNIEAQRLDNGHSQITVKIESALNNDNKERTAAQIKSTGQFEKELEEFLNSNTPIIKDIYDVQDSTATADFGDSFIDTDYTMEEPPVKKTSANLSKLIKNGKTIPFPLSADYFTKKLKQSPTHHEFETAVGEKYYSWNLDESIGLLYVKMKNGLEYYSFYTLDDSVITGLPFNLEMNYSSLEWCLQEFKGYLPQWVQVVGENDDTFLQIEFSTKDQFIHLEFFSETKNLKTVLIANKPLN